MADWDNQYIFFYIHIFSFSQTGLGSISIRLSDRPETLSAVVFLAECDYS